MNQPTKSKMTTMIGGAAAATILGFAAPLAWSQLAAAPAGAPTATAATAPATLTTPAGTAESKATPVAAKTKGLHFTGPANAQQLVDDEVKALSKPLDPNFVGNPATIKVGPVLPVWRLSPTDIGAGKGLESAETYFEFAGGDKQYHYRCLLLNGGKGVADTEIQKTEGGEARALKLGIPGEAGKIVPALAKLAEMPEVKAGSYEVRYLSLGGVVVNTHGLVFFVLWLKADDGEKDLIYPTTKVSGNAGVPGWEAKLYAPVEFFKIAQPLAEQTQSIQRTPNTRPPAGG